MKTLRKIFLLSVILTFALYVGTNLAFNWIAGKEINIESMLSIGLGISIVYSIVYYAGISVSMKPKFKYLESKDSDEPIFGDKRERIIILKKNKTIDFLEIKNVIKRNWIITYFNDDEKIIKYRMKMNFGTWGAGVLLKFDIERNQLKIVCFPIAGYTQKGDKLALQMIEKTEILINK